MLRRWPSPLRALDPRPACDRPLVRRVQSIVGVALACLSCVAMPAWCQSAAPGTRAAEAEAARRAKAADLADDPPPGRIEQAINYIEDSRIFPRIFNPPRGWFGQIGGVGEGNGFTMGGGYRQPLAGGAVTARAVGSLRQSYLGSLEYTRNFLPRDSAFVTVTATRRHEAVQRFYGTGPDTSFDDRTSFGLSAALIEASSGLKVTSWLTGSAGIGYLNPDITQSSEVRRVRDAGVAFDETTAPGVKNQPTFFITQASVVVDTRKTLNPRRGGFYTLQFRRYDDRNGGHYSFDTTRIDLQQFIPFWNESRVLAVRVMAEHADGFGQAQVPFYLMPTLGGARLLRGYDRQRFRDRSALLVSAEYRYEVNPFLMGALFYDAGQVAPDWSAFRLKDLRDAYGFGLRFGYSNAVALRTDVVFGGEDPVRLILGFTTSF
jgi:hypothetical protein